MWSLAAVDGAAIPASIGPDAVIVGGDLQMLADHSFWKRTRAIIGGASFQDWQDGTWSMNGPRLELSVRGTPGSTIGVWDVGSIKIPGVRSLR